MTREHPVEQPIRGLQIDTVAGAGPDGDGNAYYVGDSGVTRIEACTKPGMHCDIPYVRVWADERCISEFCQHNIVGVYFDKADEPVVSAEAAPAAWPIELSQEEQVEAAKWKPLGIFNHVRGVCTTCERSIHDCLCLPF